MVSPATGRPFDPPGYPVLVVDHHDLVGTALTMAFRVRGFDARQLPRTALDDFLSRPPRGRTGVAVIDLALCASAGPSRSGTAGAELVESFRRLGWKVLVVIETEDEAEAEVEVAAAIASGALGSVPKSTTTFDNLIHTVASAAQDKAVMSEAEYRDWVARHRVIRRWESNLSRMLARLSKREREVLDMLAEGHRAASIAEQWVVSITTVRTQIRAILSKLEVRSQEEAVALLRPPPDRVPRPRTPLGA